MIIGWRTTELDGQGLYFGPFPFVWDGSFTAPVDSTGASKAVHTIGHIPCGVHQTVEPGKVVQDAGIIPKGVKG